MLQFTINNDGDISGRLIVAKQSYPVTGKLNAAVTGINGKWINNGVQNDFVADMDAEHGKLSLRTNGKTVAMTLIRPKAAAQNPNPQVPASVLDKPVVQDAPAGQTQIVNGKFFTVPVPQGWKHMEQLGDTVVISPDGKTSYGLSGRPTRGLRRRRSSSRNTSRASRSPT